MRKPQFPFILVGVLVFSYAAFHLGGLILAGLGLSVAYLTSLWLHPRMRHGRCNGTGEHRGTIFTWVHRKCPGCQSGRIVRWGAGQFGTGHIRTEYKRGRDARARAKSGHTWR